MRILIITRTDVATAAHRGFATRLQVVVPGPELARNRNHGLSMSFDELSGAFDDLSVPRRVEGVALPRIRQHVVREGRLVTIRRRAVETVHDVIERFAVGAVQRDVVERIVGVVMQLKYGENEGSKFTTDGQALFEFYLTIIMTIKLSQ